MRKSLTVDIHTILYYTSYTCVCVCVAWEEHICKPSLPCVDKVVNLIYKVYNIYHITSFYTDMKMVLAVTMAMLHVCHRLEADLVGI